MLFVSQATSYFDTECLEHATINLIVYGPFLQSTFLNFIVDIYSFFYHLQEKILNSIKFSAHVKTICISN